jgi:hypothetical protein
MGGGRGALLAARGRTAQGRSDEMADRDETEAEERRRRQMAFEKLKPKMTMLGDMMEAMGNVVNGLHEAAERQVGAAGAPARAEPAQPTLSAPAAKSDPRLAEQEQRLTDLRNVLRGKVLKRAKNHSDRGYSGSGSYSERTERLALHDYGTYTYEERSFSSVSIPGMTLPRESRSSSEGTWSVEMRNGDPSLVLRSSGGEDQVWRTEDGGRGVQYLDGVPWSREKMR